jgi:pyruvate/2-oxoglutarate dehydrogenase complex dihydrolipoamide acyltransferase (E2) component
VLAKKASLIGNQLSMNESICEPTSYTVAPVRRARWNVLDILSWVSRKAVCAHLLCDVDTEAAEKLAERLSQKGEKITITAVLLKAIAIAQLAHPDSRSYKLPWGLKVTRPFPVAGFTVERLVDGDPAVFFAAIADAHKKPLAEVAREISAYGHNHIDSVTQLTKEHLLSKVPWILRRLYICIAINIPVLREILNPATFGLTSLGKFGMGPPIAPNVTTAIFGIGSMEPKPVVINGKIEVRNVIPICLSADIRVLDMYEAARLLRHIKDLLEGGLVGHLHDSEIDSGSEIGSKSQVQTKV